MRSAVKREERTREVYNFNILEKKGKDFLFEVECQPGLYVRTLIHNLGFEIGGANMTCLRRTKESFFIEKDAVDMNSIARKIKQKNYSFIKPTEILLNHYPSAELKKTALEKAKNGSPISADMIKGRLQQGIIALTHSKKLTEMAESDGKIAKPIVVLN